MQTVISNRVKKANKITTIEIRTNYLGGVVFVHMFQIDCSIWSMFAFDFASYLKHLSLSMYKAT